MDYQVSHNIRELYEKITALQGVSQALAFAGELVQEAGRIALRHFRQPLDVANKLADGRFDPVTVADREVESFLVERIRARFPDHGIVGEEHGVHEGRSPYSWIIDPIDGTRAFISGVPAWGILLGLRENERCIAGVVHQPYLEETFCGSAGQGWLLRRGERRSKGPGAIPPPRALQADEGAEEAADHERAVIGGQTCAERRQLPTDAQQAGPQSGQQTQRAQQQEGRARAQSKMREEVR